MKGKNRFKKQLAKLLAVTMMGAQVISYAPIRANEVGVESYSSEDIYNHDDEVVYSDLETSEEGEILEQEEENLDVELEDELNDVQVDDVDLVEVNEEETANGHETTEEVMPFSGISGPGTVSAGETRTVESDITGNIIVNGGTLILDGDFTITGTVTVNNGGTFYMSAGRITGTGDRGVTVTGANAVFEMSGGAIEGNELLPAGIWDSGQRGGGVSVLSGATFNMSGGNISGNIIHGVGGSGGGVNVGSDSVFNMSGDALIDNNRIEDGRSTNVGPGVWGGGGGGVRVDGTFEMSGGIISENQVNHGQGGGVLVANGIFNMSNTAVIRDNILTEGRGGAGVSVGSHRIFDLTPPYANFNMSDNALIANNTHNRMLGTSQADMILGGGGVLIFSGSFQMIGGTIRDNIANGLTPGGGVSIGPDPNNRFEMLAGSITGNTTTLNLGGGGLHWSNEETLSTIIISSNATIVNNTAGTLERIQNSLNIQHNIDAGGRINPAPWSGTGYDHAFNNHDIRTTSARVNFNLHGGTGNFPVQHVDNGGFAIAPTEIPIRVGYRFVGWFTTAGGDVEFDFTIPITANNVSVHARWERIDGSTPEPVIHSVTFNLHGGSGDFPIQHIPDGEFATAPATDPTRTGYTFVGWFTEATGGESFVFDEMEIIADTVIHARWRRNVATPAPDPTRRPGTNNGSGNDTGSRQNNNNDNASGNRLPQTGTATTTPILAGIALAGIGAATAVVKKKKK